MERDFNFCRPKEGSFCAECCRGRGCVNLATLPDGITGCPGHAGELAVPGAFHQLKSCEAMFCLDGYQIGGRKIDSPEMLSQIKTILLELPKEEFKMSEIIRTVLQNLL